MNVKRSRGRIRLLRTLILCSILLLFVFLGYWVRSRYYNEQEVLQKDLVVKLDAAKQEATDSMVMVKVLIPALSNQTFTLHRNVRAKPGMNMKMEMVAQDSFKALPPPKDGRTKTTGFVRNVSITTRSDTGDKVFIRSFGNVLRNSGILNDSLQHLILGDDTAFVRLLFMKKLRKSKYAFNAQYSSQPLKTVTKNALVLPLAGGSSMIIKGFQPYLFRRIVPDFLFALLLLGFTSVAFWLTLRSLRQQMRLSLIRNELVSNISHELKTPVATVKVALEALGEGDVLADKNTAKDYVNIASLELNRLELLINQTLHTSLLQEGRLHMQLRSSEIRTITEQVLRTMDVRFRQQRAKLSFNIDGTDFMTAADNLHLQGVIFNVLDNALKYGGDGVLVDVIVAADAHTINISISDNGPGIPQSYLHQVFDKFFRVPASNLHNIKGYGLGLSYAAQVMKQHNGSISVKNNATPGSTFTITLPKVTPDEA